MQTKQATHTPGPWTFDTDKTDDGTWFVQDSRGQDGFCIAEAHNSGAESPEANARLIAAAPDLLEALEDFAVRSVWADCRLPAEMREELSGLYHNLVLPALRKAKGE